jgi:hypothetical protein
MRGVQFRKGQAVEITHGARTVRGSMRTISDNQVAGVIEFDGIIGGFVFAMPIMRQPDDTWHDAVFGEVQLVIKPAMDS